MKTCKVCVSALRQSLLERRLMRKRYQCNVQFFQDEIARLDAEIAKLIQRSRKHG